MGDDWDIKGMEHRGKYEWNPLRESENPYGMGQLVQGQKYTTQQASAL
jgi:hypothetical protein